MKKHLLTKISAVFFPKRCVVCGVMIPPEGDFCDRCIGKMHTAPKHFPIPDCFAVFIYRRPVNEMLKRLKTYEKSAQTAVLGKLIAGMLQEKIPSEKFDLVTFVPMTKKDYHARGFNQSQMLAKETAKKLKVPCRACLKKIRQTEPQHTLGRFQRMRNLKGAFACKKPETFRGKRILVIDDITTTGSTLLECRETLELAGAGKVTCAAVAAVMPEAYSYQRQ